MIMLRAGSILVLFISIPALTFPMEVRDLSSSLARARLETTIFTDRNGHDLETSLSPALFHDGQQPRYEARSGNEETGMKKYLPVLLSVLVPGAGEIYTGYYKRGAVLVAMEATAWIGYAHYHNEGLDTRKAYEAFADEHWDFNDFLHEHPSGYYATLEELEEAGRTGAYKAGLAGEFPELFYMPFVSKEEDKQHYYENAGKYNWFISGWDDWNSSVVDGRYTDYTENRTTYKAMRAESNDQLTTANRFIYLSIAARAYSLFEMIILTRRTGEPEEPSSSGFNLRAKPEGWYGAKFVLEYNFK